MSDKESDREPSVEAEPMRTIPGAKPSKYDLERQRKAILKKRQLFETGVNETGKKNSGPPFEASPSVIEFKDFTLNEPHLKTILLTNVSSGGSQFKILPIEDEFRVRIFDHEDYFEVFYVPPGKMSAGINCKVTIKFTPQLNQNIDTKLPISTTLGMMSVPIRCTYRKAVVTAASTVIDFGDVLYGEDKEQDIILKNDGALETMVKIKDGFGRSLKDKTEALSVLSRQQSMISENDKESKHESQDNNAIEEDDDMDIFQELKFQKLFKIQGYSDLKIPVKYIPKKIREWSTYIEISFENFMHSPPIRIELKGRCVDLPISVEKKVYDMDICLMGNTYRDELVFNNSGSTAMKVQVVIPKETKQFIQLNPSFGYIQAHSKLNVWIKIVLSPEFTQMCAKYRRGEGEYIIPIQLVCSDQRLPVNFDLRVRVTTNNISIEPKTIDFGMLYPDTAKKVEIEFENVSNLPQYMYFYPLPKTVTYEPAQIPLAILPKESIKVGFVYRAYEVRKEEDFIRAKIVTGNISVNQIKLPYKAAVVKCPLKFSSLKIDFPALQIGETANHLVLIKNYSSKSYICEFFLPFFEICGIKVSPMVFRLQKGKAIEVSVEFNAQMRKLKSSSVREITEATEKNPDLNPALKKKMLIEAAAAAIQPEEPVDDKGKKGAKAAPPKPAAPAPKKTKKELEEEEERKKKEEEERKQKELELERQREEEERRFDVDAELMKLGGQIKSFEENGFESQHYKWLVPCYFKPEDEPETARSAMYLEITTVTTSKVLIADKGEINFGEIAVGFRKVEELLITNLGKTKAILHMDLLPLLGGFTVLNALKEIEPGKTRNVVVQFEPYNQQEFKSSDSTKFFNEHTNSSEQYNQTLTIKSGQSSVSVKLKGTSVKPEVTITPEDGLINMGNTLPGEKLEKTFDIKNVSNFSLDFNLELMHTGLARSDGQDAFLYIPSKGTIKAGESVQIRLIFNPDRVSEQYYNLIKIDVPNQKTERRLWVKGACYPRQAFVCHFKPFEFPKPGELGSSIEKPLDFVRVKDSMHIIGSEVKTITLEFPKLAEAPPKDSPLLEKRIVIGSCKLNDSKLEKPVNFDLNLIKDENSEYFTLENNKGTVTAGNTQMVKVKFIQAQPDSFIANIKAFKGIGQWVEAKGELKLSGGYVTPGSEDAIVIIVKLRAYIEKI